MRIVRPWKGLLAVAALVAAQAVSPARGQHATYSQPPVQSHAQPAYGAPMQPSQPAFMPGGAQPMAHQVTSQGHAPAPQQNYAGYAAPVSQGAPQAGYSQSAPPFTFAQPVQRPAQPNYTATAPTQPTYQVAQRPIAQTVAPQQKGPASVYTQFAPAPGSSAGRPADIVNRYATAPAASAQTYPQAAPAYSAPYAPPRVAMAFQPQDANQSNFQLTPSAEEIAPAPGTNDAAAAPVVPADAYPTVDPYPAVDPNAPPANGSAAGADGSCQPGVYEGYPGYDYNSAAYGACNTYSTYGYEKPGMMARLLGRRGGGYWFGGVYGLVMDRDSSNEYPLAFAANGMANGDYPTSGDIVMTSGDVDSDFQGGVEFRFGRTFGSFAVDPCGYGSCGGPKWAMEGVYWELFENNDYAQYVDTGSVRTYSMMPMRGLLFDPGSGMLPVNEFWDYGSPVAPSTIIVTMTKARSSFEARNFELNLLRLSICGDACAGPAMCNVGCEDGACETCPTGQCSTGQCGMEGYGYGLGGRFASRFSCTGVCGVRYLELDESFMYGVNYYNTNSAMDGYLDYWSNTENKLVGFQLGCNGMYRIGCKWGLHMNTLVGLYGNDIDVEQYFVSSGGSVTYANGGAFDVDASKTDVSMLGELRLGASYQATPHCRVYGGWRAMGITGVALATSQTPTAFLDTTQMSNYVNSNGSLILHGLQTGVEWNY